MEWELILSKVTRFKAQSIAQVEGPELISSSLNLTSLFIYKVGIRVINAQFASRIFVVSKSPLRAKWKQT